VKKGTIERYSADREFGFIRPEDGTRDVYFTNSVVRGEPAEGARVEYEADPSPRGPTARRVVVLPPRNAGRGRGHRQTTAALPQECIFDTFYADNGEPHQELFFGAARQAAKAFEEAGLSQVQLRQVYQGMMSFARPLQDNRITFDAAKTRFGIFYVERIVRQANRETIPKVVKEFFDAHCPAALSSRNEMLGLFRYVTNVLCYFAG